MRNYLSFGGGVNSVAAYLWLLDQGEKFVAVFVDTCCEKPTTYKYLREFQKEFHFEWIYPKEGSLYDYCWKYRMVPSVYPAWCSVRFKREVFSEWVEKPCFKMLAFDAGESHRAKINIEDGVETRYPLLEANMNRVLCKRYIKDKGLEIPPKSSCYFCPQQTIAEWKLIRREHPDLFCKAEQLEQRNMEYRVANGKQPMFLYSNAKPLRVVVDEGQEQLFKRDEYPPCECML
jgi:hypothetical protein